MSRVQSTIARPPSPREVRIGLRRARSSPPPWRARLANWFERLLYIAVFGGIGYELAAGRLGQDVTSAAGASSPVATVWALVCLSTIAVLVLAKVLFAFGPIFAGPSQLSWIVSSPVDRRGLLLDKLVVLIAAGLMVGAVWPILLLGLTGPIIELSMEPFAGAAAIGVALVSVSVVVQRSRLGVGLVQKCLSGAIALTVLALLAGIMIELGGGSTRPGEPLAFHGSLAGIVVVGAAIAASAGLIGAVCSLGRIRRDSLGAGSELASATAVSITFFEFALLGSIMLERRARLIGRVRSMRLRGSPMIVLVRVDLLRVLRNHNALLVWVALIPLPVVAGLGSAANLVPALHLVVAFLATDRLAGGLRFVCRSASLRRQLALSITTLHLAHLVIPALGALLWCAVTVLLTPGVSMANGALSAIGAVAVVYRIATRPPIDYGAMAYDFGLFGPTPVGLVLQLSRGPALLVVLGWIQITLLS